MADTHQLLLAIDPVILLLSLGVFTVITTRRVGLSPIVGYLTIGPALSLDGRTASRDTNRIEVLSKLDMVFLLFDIGLDFSLTRIQNRQGAFSASGRCR